MSDGSLVVSTEPRGPQVWVTVESVFDTLDMVLDCAVTKGGNEAKSVAWDVRLEFLRILGPYLRKNGVAA